jgi:hypothetical protein
MEKKTTEFEKNQAAHRLNPLARMGRMAICVLSFGMVYPNAFIESVDVAAYDADNAARGK